MGNELKIVPFLIKSLEESADTLERSVRHQKGISEAYLKGRVQGLRDSVMTIKEVYLVDK